MVTKQEIMEQLVNLDQQEQDARVTLLKIQGAKQALGFFLARIEKAESEASAAAAKNGQPQD